MISAGATDSGTPARFVDPVTWPTTTSWAPHTSSAGETMTTLTSTVTVFYSKELTDDFPELDYIYLPEREEDVQRRARMKAEVERYLPQQQWGLRLVKAVYPKLWPQGRYDWVKQLGQTLPKADPQCTWSTPAGGGLPQHHYMETHAASLEECRRDCCSDPACRAVDFSEGQCLLHADAWSPELPGPEGHQIHLRGDDVERPWWEEVNLNIAKVGPGDTFWRGENSWPEHHAGCGLSHLITWLDALGRGVSNMVVLESDGFPSELENKDVGGNASDWADIVAALPSQAPEGWHLIMLDKGLFGAKPNPKSVATIRPASGGGRRAYELIPWGGSNVAGIAQYMVSRAFLSWFPSEIRDRGFNMVDAWLESRCGQMSEDENPNPLSCYSVIAADMLGEGPAVR